MSGKVRIFSLLIFPLTALLFPGRAGAIPGGDTWVGGNGAWNVSGNWSGGIPTLSGSVVVNSGTATIASGTSGLAGTLVVGTSGTGAVVLNGTALSTFTINEGTGAGSSGLIIVNSGTVTGNLTIGGSGSGTLVVSGGVVSTGTEALLGASAGSSGTATVTSGTWSSFFNVIGQSGTGVLNISGGTVSFVDTTLAFGATSTGILNFSGGVLNTGTVQSGSGAATINFTTATSSTFTPQINGTFTVNQTGPGRTVVTATNSYAGSTAVSAGTLTVNGAILNSLITVSGSGLLNGSGTTGNVTVNSGGVLGGSLASKAVTINAGGTMSAGNSPGADSATNLTVSGSATFKVDIAVPGSGTWAGAHPAAGVEYDQTTLSGSINGVAETVLTLNSTPGTGSILQLNISGTLPAAEIASNANPFIASGSNSAFDHYYVLNLSDSVDTISGRFAQVTADGTNFTNIDYSATNLFGGVNGIGTFTLNGQLWEIDYLGNQATNSTIGGNDVVLTAVPEPSAYLLLGAGLAGLVVSSWRGKRRASAA